MRKLLLTGVAFATVFTIGSAMAADLSIKAPAYKAPVVYTWTGCHVGIHAGWGWGSERIFHADTFAIPIRSGTGNMSTDGAMFGGQVGCDYQFAGNWVLGIQGSFSGTDINGASPDPVDPNSDDHLRSKIASIWSITGRLGYAWTPQSLIYVRGGFARVRDKLDFTQADFGTFTYNYDLSANGWTVGVGAEWMIAANWSAFVEYNYYQFDTINVPVAPIFVNNPVGAAMTVRDRIDTVKVGVNYRFGYGPVVANY